MTFNNFEKDSSCVGGRHRSATKSIHGSITSKGSKKLIGFCSNCNRKKSLTVSVNTMKTDGFASFFSNLGKVSAETGIKLTTNALKNPSRFLKIGAHVATAAASNNSRAAL